MKKYNFQTEEKYTDLEKYLLMDLWQSDIGLFLLCGWHPETNIIPEIGGTYYYTENIPLTPSEAASNHKPKERIIEQGKQIYSTSKHILLLNNDTLCTRSHEGREALKHYHTVSEIWKNCNHQTTTSYQSHSPCYFIKWAKSKSINIPWLEWARENSFIDRENTGNKPSLNSNTELSTKTKNCYLKTIYALSAALCKGLTGNKHTDANAVLAALDAANVQHPIENKALAKYLDEGKKLDDEQ